LEIEKSSKKKSDADRAKKIEQVRRQLDNSSVNFVGPSNPIVQPEEPLPDAPVDFVKPLNTQTKEIKSSAEMTEKKIVAPGSKDAPRFKSSKPEELRRFIRLMEDLWKEAKIEDDESKKMMIGKYADPDSEEEWAAFSTMEKGHTWEEFKEELIENYPEAAAAERGTPARIRQLCSETSTVRLGDMPALYAFRRAFMAEAKKLQKPPAAMANRELVELFIGCLSESLASAVLQFLGSNLPKPNFKEKGTGSKEREASSSEAAEAPKSTARRPEDKYDLADVCNAAIRVSEDSQGMFSLMKKESSSNTEGRGVFLFNQPISEGKVLSEKVEELESVQALERDRLVNINKTMESKINGLEGLIRSYMAQSQANGACKGDCKGSNCKVHENQSAPTGPTQKWGGKSMENERCFWCGLLGHFQADCEDLKNQLRLGNVKINPEGKLRIKDGSFIPNYPAGATLKERVERHYAKKPSQFYYGEYEDNDPPVTGALSQFLGTNNDADKRTIAQLKAELDLRKREEALEQRRKILEQEEKKMEQTGGNSRLQNILDLLGPLSEEEVAAIRAARGSSFQ
jgi:hypothetical protein